MNRVELGMTGIEVSRIGLGTVKFGRNQQVKYPQGFSIPSDRELISLLSLSRELGINLIDTAPAYGSSEERLGRLLPGPREDWVIVGKVGESFEQGRSTFDFSAAATRETLKQSLNRLGTDYLDVVLIHSDGEDMRIYQQEAVFQTLQALKQEGLVRAIGMSSKSVAGGLHTVAESDVVMATYNPDYQAERVVLDQALKLNKGVLIKKGLNSGHVSGNGGVRSAFSFIYDHPAVSSVIVGTINPQHLIDNVRIVERLGR